MFKKGQYQPTVSEQGDQGKTEKADLKEVDEIRTRVTDLFAASAKQLEGGR